VEIERGRVDGGGDTRDDDGGREEEEARVEIEGQRGHSVARESALLGFAACGVEQGRCCVFAWGSWR